MLDPKLAAKLDQTTAGMRDTLPAIWGALFTGCLANGFSRAEALELVKTYMQTTILSNAQRPQEPQRED